MVAAACALAACGAAEGDDARAAAPAAESAAPADSAAAAGRGGADSPAADTAYAFRVHETRPGTADSITVTRAGQAVQTLVPGENHVLPEAEVGRISRIDLDFDGHADLAFVTELTMAGSHSQYWRLDPAAGRFTPAGVHATLQPDSAARELTSYVRGGHAGRLWNASRWRWVDGALAEVRHEEQDALGDGVYVRIVRERRGGALVETSRDTLDEAELAEGPSWRKPEPRGPRR
jgi:hypothetical protein